MKFLVVGLNYAPEPTATGVYTAELCQTLVELQQSVTVVCAHPYYPYWRTFDGFRGVRWVRSTERGVDVTRCPIYVPLRVNGLKRIVHYISFALSAAVPVLFRALHGKPDIIVSIGPTLLAAPIGLLAARLTGSKTQIHIQDFEVEAGFATGQMGRGGMLARIAMGFGDAMIRSHDLATSISSTMVAKLVEKRGNADSCFELRNWAASASEAPPNTAELTREWDIQTPYMALYSGSITRKQGLETVVEAAALLSDRKDLTIVICGNGPHEQELRDSGAHVPNLKFFPLQPKSRLRDLLSLATIHLLPQKADAADLVLPSKLTNMLASGRPTVACATVGTGLANEVEGCGLVVAPENPQAMADAILQLLENRELYAAFSAEAVARAEQRWARMPIISRYLRWIETKIAPA